MDQRLPLEAIDFELGLWLYFSRPETWIAVILPGALSLLILWRAPGRSAWLTTVWAAMLPLSFAFAVWQTSAEGGQLTIMSAFSIAVLFWLWRGYSMSPPNAFALTFFGLLYVDLMHALLYARAEDLPLSVAYLGVGGAGAGDALFIVPYLTATAVGYANFRRRVHPPTQMAKS
jgi:hypothetical protein